MNRVSTKVGVPDLAVMLKERGERIVIFPPTAAESFG
jgi:hypothetical protein